MDNQGVGGQKPQWGRWDQGVGAVVDDASKSIWGKGVGWVRADGGVRWKGRDFALADVPAELQSTAQALAQKARGLFADGGLGGLGGGTPQATPIPVPEQMRQVQASASAPPAPSPPSLPRNPSHDLVAKSFKTLAAALTGGK